MRHPHRRLTWTLLSCTALAVLVACATAPPRLSPAAERVRITPESQLGSFCEYSGMVRAERGANFQSLDANLTAAEHEVREKAARMRATHLVIQRHGKDADQQTWAHAGGSGQCQNCVTLEAMAYTCP